MKTFFKRLLIFIIAPLLVIILMVGIGIGYFFWTENHKPDLNMDPAFAPVINPHPQYFMTIKGFIDPALPKELSLQIISTFSTNTDECQYIENSFQGPIPRDRTITLSFKIESKKYYKLKIPIDYFIPGNCQWKIQEMDFISYSQPGHEIEQSLAIFDINSGITKTVPKTLIFCDKKFDCQIEAYGYFNHKITPNYSYTHTIDYMRKSS